MQYEYPEGPTKVNRRGARILAVTALLLGVAAVGAVAGHEAWRSTGEGSATSALPLATGSNGNVAPYGNSGGFGSIGGNSGSAGFGFPGDGTSSGGTSTGGSGSNASGGPSDPGTIATRVDGGLVDIDTTLSYQDAEAAGTGMVLTPGGEVLTNNHVIEEATSVSVTDLGNGKTYGATVVGYDRTKDVAILKLTGASGLKTVTVGNSSTLRSGDAVVGIGNAGGVGGTPSYAGGSITATNQSITASDEGDGTSEQLSGLLSTNADIEAGDSGGPLVDSSGQVVGMDTAGSSSPGGFEFEPSGSATTTSGFAIPINTALAVARQIEAGEKSSTVHIGPTAFLGIEAATASGSGGPGGGYGYGGGFGSGNTGTTTSGVQITDVIAGSTAADAGLIAGDVITSLDGKGVTTSSALTNIMINQVPGHSVTLVYEDPYGQQHTVTTKLHSGPPQ
jgi:S1-C subfamily serine protease